MEVILNGQVAWWCQDDFLIALALFRENVGRGQWKAGGEPHAWSSGSNIAS